MYNKFEKGDTFYNLFKGDMGVWAEQVRKFQISTSQLTNAFTSPVTLVPAVPGFMFVPTMLVMNKPAGGNCGVAGVSSMGAYWRGGSVTAIILTSLGTNFFATSDNVQCFLLGPTNGGVLYTGLTTAVPVGDQYGNRDLVFATAGANLTVSAGAPTLTLLLAWRQVPLVLPLS